MNAETESRNHKLYENARYAFGKAFDVWLLKKKIKSSDITDEHQARFVNECYRSKKHIPYLEANRKALEEQKQNANNGSL